MSSWNGEIVLAHASDMQLAQERLMHGSGLSVNELKQATHTLIGLLVGACRRRGSMRLCLPSPMIHQLLDVSGLNLQGSNHVTAHALCAAMS